MIHPLAALVATVLPVLLSQSKSTKLKAAAFIIPLVFLVYSRPDGIELAWWLAPFGWSINVDPAALFFARIASTLTFLVALYSSAFIQPPAKSFYAWLGLFQVAAIGVLFSADFLNFFLFWELVALCIYFLIRPNEPDVAHRYFVIQFLGAGVLFAGIMILNSTTGTMAVGPVPQALLPLFLVGLGVKAALWGLHFWLPDAHTKAPTPVSALLSGFAVKLGVYGFIRILPDTNLLMYLGLLMAIYGGVYALLQHDSKTLLAYSTISQLGYIVAAVGVGAHGAAMDHSLSHALFKSLLFLAVGAAGYRLGTRDLLRMGGLAKTMPLTTLAATVAALAIAGIPPLNGFASKQLIKEALSDQGALVYILSFADYLTVIYIAKLMYYGFYRRPQINMELTPLEAGFPQFTGPKAITEAPTAMTSAMLIMAGLCILTGLVTIPADLPTLQNTIASPWTAAKVSGPIFTGIVGLTIFLLARPILRPTPRDINDIGWFYGIITAALEYGRSQIQRLHTGNLNHYLAWYIGFLVMVLLGLMFRL